MPRFTTGGRSERWHAAAEKPNGVVHETSELYWQQGEWLIPVERLQGNGSNVGDASALSWLGDTRVNQRRLRYELTTEHASVRYPSFEHDRMHAYCGCHAETMGLKFMAGTSQPAPARQFISTCARSVLMRHCGGFPVRPR